MNEKLTTKYKNEFRTELFILVLARFVHVMISICFVDILCECTQSIHKWEGNGIVSGAV